jgi:hypothetical protein
MADKPHIPMKGRKESLPLWGLALFIMLFSAGTVSAGTLRITVEDTGDSMLRIGYEVVSGSEMPVGFGLNISLSAPATFWKVVSASPYFPIYPGTIVIHTGELQDFGTPIAPRCCYPDTLGGLGTSGVTIEMGVLGNPLRLTSYDPRDFNWDGLLDLRDLVLFVSYWLVEDTFLDLDGKGVLNLADYGIFVDGRYDAPPTVLRELLLFQLNGNGAETTTVTISENSTRGGVVDSKGIKFDVIFPEPFTMVVSDPAAVLRLGKEEIIQADSIDIDVGDYSIPSFVDWNNDGLKDLAIGQGSGTNPPGKVRVYLNMGTEAAPRFSSFLYAQSNGVDLTCTASVCMGCFPRVVYWNADARKDLLVGQADGTIKIFLNIGTDESPTFDGGTLLQVGQLGSKTNIKVGSPTPGIATPCVVDWNSDGKKDLVVGALDGEIHIFINEGTDTVPNFLVETVAQANYSPLIVPSQRSSPQILDLDGDGKKDILTGNTEGQLLFYSNVTTGIIPAFSSCSLVDSNGVPIDLPDTPRSRPFVCNWTQDGYLDVLIGAGDGKVRLYMGIPRGDLDNDYDVDFTDFALFSHYWQKLNCGECGGANLTDDRKVDIDDLREYIANWLAATK